eukprot:tig00000383_g24625.t1
MAAQADNRLAQAAQILIARRVIPEHEMEEYAREFGDGNADSFAATMRERLRLFKISVERIRCEATGAIVYGVVNTVGDKIAQLWTDMTELQIAYMNRIVEKILEQGGELEHSDVLGELRVNLVPAAAPAPEGSQEGASSSQPVAGSSKGAQLAPSEAERTLDSLIDKQWLTKYVRDGRTKVTLGDRSRLELTDLIEAAKPNLPPCALCKAPAFRFVQCPGEECEGGRAHEGCLRQLPPGRPGKCSCGAEFPPVEGAAGGSGSGSGGGGGSSSGSRAGGSGPSRRKR